MSHMVTHREPSKCRRLQNSCYPESVFPSYTSLSGFSSPHCSTDCWAWVGSTAHMQTESQHTSLSSVSSVNRASVFYSPVYSLITASLQGARVPKDALSVSKQVHFHCVSFFLSFCKASAMCSNTSTMLNVATVPLFINTSHSRLGQQVHRDVRIYFRKHPVWVTGGKSLGSLLGRGETIFWSNEPSCEPDWNHTHPSRLDS